MQIWFQSDSFFQAWLSTLFKQLRVEIGCGPVQSGLFRPGSRGIACLVLLRDIVSLRQTLVAFLCMPWSLAWTELQISPHTLMGQWVYSSVQALQFSPASVCWTTGQLCTSNSAHDSGITLALELCRVKSRPSKLICVRSRLRKTRLSESHFKLPGIGFHVNCDCSVHKRLYVFLKRESFKRFSGNCDRTSKPKKAI